jgi:predicted nucleic acid-binding protein
MPFRPAAVRTSVDATSLYRELKRPRGREVDIVIAATAIARDAALWTLNPEDFRDIKTLTLYVP